MADESRPIFNRKATEKLRSADDLEKYVRVTNPSHWVIVVAILALIAGLMSWLFFGAESTSITTKSLVLSDGSGDSTVDCFLSARDTANVKVGDIANISGSLTSVSEISEMPLSRNEAKQILIDQGYSYMTAIVPQDEWLFRITFLENDIEAMGFFEGVPLDTVITTGSVAPITKLLGQ